MNAMRGVLEEADEGHVVEVAHRVHVRVPDAVGVGERPVAHWGGRRWGIWMRAMARTSL